MTKPFQLSDLISASKAEGAQEIAVIFAWIEQSISLLSPAVASIANPVLELIKEQAVKALA